MVDQGQNDIGRGQQTTGLDDWACEIARCRVCVERPIGTPLAHTPRPIVRLPNGARILLAGQAPGARVHASGTPFDDPSGDRLRYWLGVDRPTFYDTRRFAIVPMGFCFPGHDAKGADLPPRRECRATWHDALMAAMPAFNLIVAIGAHAAHYHLRRHGLSPKTTHTETVAAWRDWLSAGRVRIYILPHPSWRNTEWLKRNAWFDADVLPRLRVDVARLISSGVTS